MGRVRYSSRAEDDLYEIAIYTLEHWGVEQSDRYMAGIEDFCLLLAGFPGMGRECGRLVSRLRRVEHESHILFFFPEDEGILVSRVFHRNRDISDEDFAEFG